VPDKVFSLNLNVAAGYLAYYNDRKDDILRKV